MGICTYIHAYFETNLDPQVQECLDMVINDDYFYVTKMYAGELHDSIVYYRRRTRSKGIVDSDEFDESDGTHMVITRIAFEDVVLLFPDMDHVIADVLTRFPQSTKFYYAFYG